MLAGTLASTLATSRLALSSSIMSTLGSAVSGYSVKFETTTMTVTVSPGEANPGPRNNREKLKARGKLIVWADSPADETIEKN